MGTGEDRFWQEVGNQLNPGWQIHLGPGGVQVPLASQDTFLYLLDTATMWITGGATLSSEMLRARRELQKLKMTPAQVAGLAAEPILECSQTQLTGDHPKVRLAMTAAVCSITATGTWSAVMDRIGSPAGHWIWMVYRLQDGESLGRPVFSQGPRVFMQEPDLHRALRTALASDLGNPNSSVSQMVRKGGGAVLHPTLQQWLTESR